MSIILDKAAETEDPGEEDPLGPLLAARIRRERGARDWSIAELAAASGVSRAMISRIERGEASPTAALLGRLSGAFGLTMSTLLARAEADGTVERVSRAAEQARWRDPETGFQRRALTPAGSVPELVLGDLPPGARIAYPASAYTFMQGQCVWVISGRLLIDEGGEETELEPGDCLVFDLATPKECAFFNPSAHKNAHYLVSLVRR
ncbi:MAG: helix-turn-helix transcriptional regulator [Rhodospirillales bacterium]|nr:helix-turn-helix transcriptional regulator [Rhodospirillales bacterium]MBO6787177.1 helix-turn-helix transcriptional regulator [Rhodospirillales bacterium]